MADVVFSSGSAGSGHLGGAEEVIFARLVKSKSPSILKYPPFLCYDGNQQKESSVRQYITGGVLYGMV